MKKITFLTAFLFFTFFHFSSYSQTNSYLMNGFDIRSEILPISNGELMNLSENVIHSESVLRYLVDDKLEESTINKTASETEITDEEMFADCFHFLFYFFKIITITNIPIFCFTFRKI